MAEYYASGMQDVVEKPIDRDILLAAIDAALDAAGSAIGQSAAEPIPQAVAE